MQVRNGSNLSSNPGRHFGPVNGLSPYLAGRWGALRNPFVNAERSQYAAWPDGYAGNGALVLPPRDGGMSAFVPAFDIVGAGTLISGGVMTGAATLGIEGAGSLSLVVSLTGAATLGIDGAGSLAMISSLTGSATLGIDGEGSLSMIVSMTGDGTLGIEGAADLRGIASLSGSWTNTGGELSPEALAAAVWNASAATFDTPATMGEKLNAAGSASNPWTDPVGIQVSEDTAATEKRTKAILGLSV
jgi:hypothetical protein